MEQHDGFGFDLGSVAKAVDVASRPQRKDVLSAKGCINEQALGADRDFTIIPLTDAGMHVPAKRPPWTGGRSTVRFCSPTIWARFWE
jgi:hypothetical protein